MKILFALCLAGLLLWAAGCAGTPRSEAPKPAATEPVAAPSLEMSWQYPIAPGVWYPGDGPLPEHPFKYYRLRCWPGCHDPNSAPQPHP